MRERLGVAEELAGDSQAGDWANCLLPPSFSRAADGFDRKYQTCELHLPEPGGVRPTTAHFVELSSGSLVLGCLGEFTSDADVPWDVWFGPEGVRESALVANQLSRLRADRTQRCQRFLAGQSTQSRRFRDQVQLACQLRHHLGLIGDPSNAMTDLASFIHVQSIRNDPLVEPYVCVDASLMDAELLEVYASAAIVPLSASAENRTTLCLERLDEMPSDGQERLVQWMQMWPDRLRLIGLLSRPIGDLNASEMRPQLADAMSVFAIPIPSLASRSEDLPLLAQSLIRSTRLSREANQVIETYPWPGGWDEFLAAMKFAEDVVRGDRITREHFPLAIRSYRVERLATTKTTKTDTKIRIEPCKEPIEAFEIPSLDEAIKAYENELIAKAMTAADGNKAEAARRLGISRARLLRKLEDA